jgi:uncharacterized membrane protein (DUF106 family)
MIDWSILIQIIAIAGVGIGVYAAIKSDLAVLHEKSDNMKEDIKEVKAEVTAFHQRIDGWYRRESRT